MKQTRNWNKRRTVLKTAAGVAAIGSVPTVAARQCDIVVGEGGGSDYSTIQDAVDNADTGDTICIKGGTYNEDVQVATEDLTLKGVTSPNSQNAVEVDGRISLESGSDGTTVERLLIVPSEVYLGGTFPDPFGIRVKASNVNVVNNIIENLEADLTNGEGSFTLHGVQVFGSGVSNVVVRNNKIRGFFSDGDPTTWPKYGGIAGVKLQAGIDTVTVEENEVTDLHSAGWAWGVVLTTSGSEPGVPSNVTVRKNDLSDINNGDEFNVFSGANGGRNTAPYPGSSFGIDGGADASGATLEQNNLLAPNGAESKDDQNTLTAECNWWSDESGPTDDDNPDGEGTWALERGSANIDYTPWLVDPAPSNNCSGGT